VSAAWSACERQILPRALGECGPPFAEIRPQRRSFRQRAIGGRLAGEARGDGVDGALSAPIDI
jgi:hypothetical protein